MANHYMRIDTVEVKGGATVEGLDGQGWFAITNFSVGAARDITMDIGNGNTKDNGVVSMSEVSVGKFVDGASEDLLLFFHSPGKEGKTIEFAYTEPAADGSGAEVLLQIKLDNGRMSSHHLSLSDGSRPYESLSFSYMDLSTKIFTVLPSGEIKPGGIITFSIPKGKLVSGAASGG